MRYSRQLKRDHVGCFFLQKWGNLPLSSNLCNAACKAKGIMRGKTNTSHLKIQFCKFLLHQYISLRLVNIITRTSFGLVGSENTTLGSLELSMFGYKYLQIIFYRKHGRHKSHWDHSVSLMTFDPPPAMALRTLARTRSLWCTRGFPVSLCNVLISIALWLPPVELWLTLTVLKIQKLSRLHDT